METHPAGRQFRISNPGRRRTLAVGHVPASHQVIVCDDNHLDVMRRINARSSHPQTTGTNNSSRTMLAIARRLVMHVRERAYVRLRPEERANPQAREKSSSPKRYPLQKLNLPHPGTASGTV